jgi:hypothetical protein
MTRNRISADPQIVLELERDRTPPGARSRVRRPGSRLAVRTCAEVRSRDDRGGLHPLGAGSVGSWDYGADLLPPRRRLPMLRETRARRQKVYSFHLASTVSRVAVPGRAWS